MDAGSQARYLDALACLQAPYFHIIPFATVFFSLQVPFLHLPSHPDCIPTRFHVKMLFLAAQNISIKPSKIIQKPQEKNPPRERTQLAELLQPLHCSQVLLSHSPIAGSLAWKSLCKTSLVRTPDSSSGVTSSPLTLPFPVLLPPLRPGFEHLPGGRAPSTELETSPRLSTAHSSVCVCGITAHPAGCSPVTPGRLGEPSPSCQWGTAHPRVCRSSCTELSVPKAVLPPPPPPP